MIKKCNEKDRKKQKLENQDQDQELIIQNQISNLKQLKLHSVKLKNEKECQVTIILKKVIWATVKDFSIGLKERNEKIQNKHDLKIFKII